MSRNYENSWLDCKLRSAKWFENFGVTSYKGTHYLGTNDHMANFIEKMYTDVNENLSL